MALPEIIKDIEARVKDTGDIMTGPLTLISGGTYIVQTQNTVSNWTPVIKWYKGGVSQATYDPGIGNHNTGGDGTGSISIVPYATETSPWSGSVGLYIAKDTLKIDGKIIPSLSTSMSDNQILRFDGTTGKIQNSKATLDDGGNIHCQGYYTRNQDSSTTENQYFGIYQWGKLLQFTVRNSDGTYKNSALNIHIDTYNLTAPGTITAPTFIGNLTGTATKATQDGNGKVIASTYFPVTGGSMKGHITMSGEYGFVGYMPRKNANGGGWAYTPFRVIGADNKVFFHIGVFGGADTLSYAYIGTGDYAESNHLRVYPNGTVWAPSVQGAVWNDYAEFRKFKDSQDIPYGRVVIENGDDSLSLSTHRLQKGGNIVSDTFGFAIGETEESKLPIAVSGRVLAYPNENRYAYGPGDAVCTGPNGTVSVMTEEEIRNYPDRIIGYVSAVPDYEIWGTGNVKVDGRIWIKVK